MDLSDSALKPAILSLCLARIGEDHNDRRVTEHAMKLYGTALKEMGRALQNSKRIQTDELLAAGKLMSRYEVSNIPELRLFHGCFFDKTRCSMAPPHLKSRHVA